jgi:hypothetical protein
VDDVDVQSWLQAGAPSAWPEKFPVLFEHSPYSQRLNFVACGRDLLTKLT